MNLHQLAVEAAARYPERPAVAGPVGVVSYAELDERAGALAALMQELGVVRGDRVAVWAEKSPDVVIAMQAVLRLGAAYVPLDPATPAARAAAMLHDCGARLVCDTGPRVRLPAGENGTRVAGLDLTSVERARSVPATEPVDPDDLAFILYTSGSTGVPKGVCISHRNARAFVDWAAAELAVVPDDRFANHAGFTFDLSVLDIYTAFSRGALVHLIPQELAYAPARLVDVLYEQKITVWYSVPSALTLMMREGHLLDRPAPVSLRAVLFAGEPFPITQVRRLAAWTDARLLNLYGPTETNVCAYHQVRPADLERDRPVPIGGAASGDTVWVTRPDGDRAGIGEVGELWVEGPTVMLGYWGGEPQRGPYATGDIVRVLPGGELDYVGRRDDMVKVHGHRVEPGEIEAAISCHPDVEEASVVVRGVGQDARLEAFVVPVAGRTFGTLAVRRHSAERLPPYMIPDRIHFVAGLPRTANGKVDKLAIVRHDGEPVGGQAEREPWCPTTG